MDPSGGPPATLALHHLFQSPAQSSSPPPSASAAPLVSAPSPPPISHPGPLASYPFLPPSSLSQPQYAPYLQEQPALWPSHVYSHHPLSSVGPSISLHARGTSRPPPSPVDSARLMALFNLQHSPAPLTSHGSLETMTSPTTVASAIIPSAPSINLVPNSGSGRTSSASIPKGRHLKGVHVVYDIDVHLQGEDQPQLEATPITMYTSDPVLFVGRKIAVNSNYICYGLRPNRHIRIINIHTGSRSLLRGHSERVTDIVFFSEDVHLLASASSDGRVFVRKIIEGPGDDSKLQITDHIILAVQFTGSWESVHPRVCWFNDAQDILVVGISKYIFVVDILKVRQLVAPNGFTTEDTVLCNVDNPIEGFCCVAVHAGEITSLSGSQLPMLASASKDGTIRIWKDQSMNSISTFVPHELQEVGAVAFLTAPHCSDHIVLISAGRLNQELKLWVPDTEDGWFPKSEAVHWKCIQTLELKSSAEGKLEDAFFNQVLVLPRAHVILLANAKRSALYALHLNFGRNPASTHLDYLAEFSVVWPILSFTATSENVYDGHGIVPVYCLQTQRIQQYSLDLSQCVPPVGEPLIADLDSIHNPISTVIPELNSAMDVNLSRSISESSTSNICSDVKNLESTSSSDSKVGVDSSEQQMKEVSSGLPLNMTRAMALSEEEAINCLLSPRERTTYNLSQDQSEMSGEKTSYATISTSPEKLINDQISPSPKPLIPDICSKEPVIQELRSSTGLSSHLVTPSELMSMVAMSRAEAAGPVPSSPEDGTISNELIKTDGSFDKQSNGCLDALMVDTIGITEGTDLRAEVKVASVESVVLQIEDIERHGIDDSSEKNITGESDLVDEGFLNPKAGEEAQFKDDNEPAGQKDHFSMHMTNETSAIKVENNSSTVSPLLPVRKKKNKNKTETSMPTSMGLSSLLPSSTLFSSIASTSQQDSNSNASVSSTAGISDQLFAMQDSLNQLTIIQKEFQKQMPSMLVIPVAKEVKRIEAVLGQRMEKVLKAHMDAMWARLQEENAKREKMERDWVQQLNSFLSNSMNTELPTAVERALKKEFASLGPSIARSITPNIEKTISSAVNEAFQKGVNEKGVTQLEKSINAKIEASLSRQIQAQFQISGKQALQEGLRSCLEESVIPAFERACQTMFTQIDTEFHKGLADKAYAQQQITSSHATLASSLQDAVASASSIVASLKGELADGQRRILSLMETAGASRGPYIINGNIPEKAVTVQHVEESLDPTKELLRLVAERKLEEAFNKALALTNIGIVSWLCNQVDLATVLTMTPPPLSQGVLLALVQQLGCDLGNDTAKKLQWIKDAALALNPHDSGLPTHVVRHFLEQLYTNLHALLADSKVSAASRYTTRLVIHVVNSLLTAYK